MLRPLSILLSITLVTGTTVTALDVYEQPPVFHAKAVLPPNLLEGPHHRVLDEVNSDGYLNQYRVESDFGDYEIESTLMLRVRVREMGALAELERVSKTKVFADAAIDAGLSPARAVVSFAQHPVETVTGIPAGIGRFFKRASRQTKEGYGAAKDAVSDDDEASPCEDIEDEAEQEQCIEERDRAQRGGALHERYFGLSDAERRWHESLGTDPYTSNDVLYEAVKSVAWADRLGRFSIRFAGVPSIPGVGYIADANKLVWRKDPWELRDYNAAVLTQIGLDEDAIEAFFDNPWLSPTLQTTLIAALASLQDVPGRDYVLKAAVDTENEAEARFVVQSVIGLTWFNASQSRIVEFLPNPYFPVARVEDHRAIAMLPLDYLAWTEEMATYARDVGSRYTSPDIESREVWLLGDVSDLARREMSGLGWTVKDRTIDLVRQAVAELDAVEKGLEKAPADAEDSRSEEDAEND